MDKINVHDDFDKIEPEWEDRDREEAEDKGIINLAEEYSEIVVNAINTFSREDEKEDNIEKMKQ